MNWWQCLMTCWAIMPEYLQGMIYRPGASVDFESDEALSREIRAFSMGGQDSINPTQMYGDVAVIDVRGMLSKSMSIFRLFGLSNQATLPEIEAAIRVASGDTAIRGIVLRVDSPGGTVAGTDRVSQAIREARQRKPVATAAEDIMGSGGYWLGSQATPGMIYVSPTCLTGSIGVYAPLPDESEAYAKEGVKIHMIRDGEFKGAGHPGTQVTEAQINEYEKRIKALGQIFVQAVAMGRGVSFERANQWKDGRVHVGAAAIELGLVDRLGGLADAISAVQQASNSGRVGRG